MTPKPPDPADDDAADADLAPRPRPGFRSRPAPGMFGPLTGGEVALIASGVVRAVAGVAGFFAALLYLPTHPATPVLAGVSLLMIVTGNISVLRVTRSEAGLRWFGRGFAGISAVVSIVVVVLTAWLGAGSFGPFSGINVPNDPDGTIRFEAP